MSKNPFKQKIISENSMIRMFSKDVLEDDLTWHRDNRNRVIEVISGNGWLFQRDGSIPEMMKEGRSISIAAKEWHRIIKGKDDLVIKITESLDKNESGFNYAAAKAAVAGKKEFKFGGETHPVKMSKSKAEKILSEMEKEMSESDNPHPDQYDAPQGSKRDKELDATKADLASGDPKRVQRAYRRRERMEKRDRKEESLNTLSRDEMIEIIQEVIAEVELDEMLSEIDERLDEKLSAKTKATLKKKAEKRGLTPGSVYAEFRKGLAAWATSGSRKGMSQHQWAHARVNSATPSKSWAVVKKAKKKKKSKKKK